MTEPVVDSALADNTTATQSTISSEGAAAEGAAPASAEALESAPTGSHFYIYDFISFVCWETNLNFNTASLHGCALHTKYHVLMQDKLQEIQTAKRLKVQLFL